MEIERAARVMLGQLCERHPMGYVPSIVLRNYRVSAGMAYYKAGVIGLSKTILRTEEQLADTLRHEYAHLLSYYRHGRKAIGHGAYWKQAMFELGMAPKVRHNYEVRRNKPRQEVGYLCQRCGKTLVRTRRLPRKRRYIHNGCGGSIKYAWTRPVTPQPSVA